MVAVKANFKMAEQIDKKAQARIVGAIVGAILGVVVAFAFGYAKPDTREVTVSRPTNIGNVTLDLPNRETVTTGYGLSALVRVAAAAFAFGAVGWSLGDQAGKHLYP